MTTICCETAELHVTACWIADALLWLQFFAGAAEVVSASACQERASLLRSELSLGSQCRTLGAAFNYPPAYSPHAIYIFDQLFTGLLSLA